MFVSNEECPRLPHVEQVEVRDEPLVAGQDELLRLGLEEDGLQPGPRLASGADHQHGEDGGDSCGRKDDVQVSLV